jgi:putative colanic acid biosynthesis UDP-glucose lipid carrier transferase
MIMAIIFRIFSDKENIEIKGKLEKLKIVLENEIDEIYCSLKEVSTRS